MGLRQRADECAQGKGLPFEMKCGMADELAEQDWALHKKPNWK